MRIKATGLIVFSAVLMSVGVRPVWAGTTTRDISSRPVDSTELLGNFEATLTYTPDAGGNSALLTVELTNTSNPDNGGYITAFAFNSPELSGTNLVSGVTLQPGTNFTVLGGDDFDNAVQAQPFGFFDFGASITNAFQGGGSPLAGIHTSDGPQLFEFVLNGSGLHLIDAGSFVTAFSVSKKGTPTDKFFVARFRGFDNGGSDKVPAGDDGDPNSCTMDDECNPGEICEAGSCIPNTNMCVDDLDCELGEVCEFGTCVPGGGGGD